MSDKFGQLADYVKHQMVFPGNPELYVAYCARGRIEEVLAASGAAETVAVSTADLRLALAVARGRDSDWRVSDSVQRGIVAGALLSLLYQMHVYDLGEPSMFKAMTEYQEWANGRRFGNNKALPISKQTMRNCWTTHAPVAHFWAAYELSKFKPSPYARSRETLFSDPADFRVFLGVARAIGEFATTFIVKRTKPPKPFIDPAMLVPVPGDVPAIRLKPRPV